MRLRRRGIRAGLLTLTVGTVFAVAGTCTQTALGAIMASLDPCAILNCTGGAGLSGVLDFCGVPGDPTDDIFVRCP